MKKPQANDKFYPDKSYRYFPGVAIIHGMLDDAFQQQLETITHAMKQSSLFDSFVFLKPASYHMTVADLITYKHLQSNGIYQHFPLKDANRISQLDAHVQDVLGKTTFPLDITMVPVKITSRKVLLEPKTDEDAEKLKDFRAMLYEKLKIEPNGNYQFHVSLTYRLYELSEDQRAELDAYLETLNEEYLKQLKPLHVKHAELMAFNDMAEFRNIERGRDCLGVCQTKKEISDKTM